MCAWLPKQRTVDSMEANMNNIQPEQIEIMNDLLKKESQP